MTGKINQGSPYYPGKASFLIAKKKDGITKPAQYALTLLAKNKGKNDNSKNFLA